MCIGLHTLPPCLLFCGNYILHESEYDVHIFCVALDIIIYPMEHFMVQSGRTVIAADDYTFNVFRESDNCLLTILAEVGQLVHKNK